MLKTEQEFQIFGKARPEIPFRLAPVCCAIKAGPGCGTVAKGPLGDSR